MLQNGTMIKVSSALFLCAQLYASHATAQSSLLPYEPSPVSTLLKVCTLNTTGQKSSDCMSYVRGISDLYFIMNPQCSRPDLIAFDDQVSRNIESIVKSIPQNMRDKEFAATVVFQAVSRANPCQANAVPNVVNHTACKKGLEVLSNAWANEDMKKVVLEKMRNIGCLK